MPGYLRKVLGLREWPYSSSLPLFALMGYSLFLLLQGVQSRAATISRFTTVIFVAFEVDYNTAVGLNSGILVYNATALPPAQQGVVQQALQQMYSNLFIVVSYYIFFVAGIVAICSAARVLYHVGVARLAVITCCYRMMPFQEVFNE